MALKRIQRELIEFNKNHLEGISKARLMIQSCSSGKFVFKGQKILHMKVVTSFFLLISRVIIHLNHKR